MGLPKKEIRMPLRRILLITSLLGFIGLVCGFAVAYRTMRLMPATINKSEAVYKFTHKGVVDYRVYLKPSSVLTENPVGPGKNYYTKLIDHIDLDYTYHFNADQETKLEGTYRLIATIEAKDMWQKDFILVEPTPFTSAKTKEFSFSGKYHDKITLNKFNDFLMEINQELGVPATDPKLTIKLAIDLKGETAAGPLSGSVTPTMTIPLTESRFKIDGNLNDEKSSSITQSVTVPNPDLEPRKSRVLYLAISAALFGLLLPVLLIFTKGKPVPPVDEEVVIQKKYGNRLVSVPGEIQLGDQVVVIAFNSIDELVKVADELVKPLIRVNSASEGLVYYFVFDSQVVYKYVHPRRRKFIQYKIANINVSM